MLVRTIGKVLNVMREPQCLLPVATGILGFLSIFKKNQASSFLKHCMPPYARGVKGTRVLLLRLLGDLGLSLWFVLVIQTSLHLVR